MSPSNSFEETQHPRGQVDNAGKFRKRENSDPTVSLEVPVPVEKTPLKIDNLDIPHPQGEYDQIVEAPSGRHYLRGGVHHRADGPPYVGYDGYQLYFHNGLMHRDHAEGPALIDPEGQFEQFWEMGALVEDSKLVA